MPRRSGLWSCVALCLVAIGWPARVSAAEPKRPANRLAKETSPYLLLHAHNPVDWYPWGPEAFARAKAEDRPIFLSIGYSSCYWCHVMERECFMDAAIAKLLNERFVCVKVDREERPDVDQVYMTALQAFGNGGWPMSMFLTPDGRPFYGGTYFPPKGRDGIPGFPTILEGVAEAWRDERPAVEKSADRLAEIVRRSIAGATPRLRIPPTRAAVAEGRAGLAEQFDPEYGGFGYSAKNPRRPKFPEPVNLVFLLDQHRRDVASGKQRDTSRAGPLAMVLETMDQMARGGIRDQLAGGYHRYSTVRSWTVPHFEKMLYDNAQLASAHLLAFEATGDPRWRAEAEATFAFVARSMTSPEGGFFSALDAETEGEEGAYYVWSRAQVQQALGEGGAVSISENPLSPPGEGARRAGEGPRPREGNGPVGNKDAYEAFAQVYGLKRDPNFEKDRYVLLEPRSREDQARTLETTPEALEALLAPLRAKLLAVRDARPAPLLDDKVLTSWNGLMIAAYADGFRLLKDPAHRQAAEKAADFLLTRLRAPEGRLLRTYRVGKAKLPAYLEDYAFLAHGLLRLHAATGDPKRLAQARELTDRMIADFSDSEQGGFFYTADGHESLLARPKDPYDNALPGGNSVAIRNLVALAAATGERSYLDHAGKALDAFSSAMAQNPAALPLMLVGLDEYLDARPDAGTAAPATTRADEVEAVVTAKAALAPKSEVAPGRELDVVVTLDIKEGWHLNANPASNDNLIPTAVKLADDEPATLIKVDYPEGKVKALASSGPEEVALYEGKVEVTARVRLDPKAKAPPEKLRLVVRYQACNDRACLAPARLTVPVSLVGAR